MFDLASVIERSPSRLHSLCFLQVLHSILRPLAEIRGENVPLRDRLQAHEDPLVHRLAWAFPSGPRPQSIPVRSDRRRQIEQASGQPCRTKHPRWSERVRSEERRVGKECRCGIWTDVLYEECVAVLIAESVTVR